MINTSSEKRKEKKQVESGRLKKGRGTVLFFCFSPETRGSGPLTSPHIHPGDIQQEPSSVYQISTITAIGLSGPGATTCPGRHPGELVLLTRELLADCHYTPPVQSFMVTSYWLLECGALTVSRTLQTVLVRKFDYDRI